MFQFLEESEFYENKYLDTDDDQSYCYEEGTETYRIYVPKKANSCVTWAHWRPFEDTPAWFKILYNEAKKVHEERKKLRKVLEK